MVHQGNERGGGQLGDGNENPIKKRDQGVGEPQWTNAWAKTANRLARSQTDQ